MRSCGYGRGKGVCPDARFACRGRAIAESSARMVAVTRGHTQSTSHVGAIVLAQACLWCADDAAEDENVNHGEHRVQSEVPL
jgi:hypothetical protein